MLGDSFPTSRAIKSYLQSSALEIYSHGTEKLSRR